MVNNVKLFKLKFQIFNLLVMSVYSIVFFFFLFLIDKDFSSLSFLIVSFLLQTRFSLSFCEIPE